MSLGNHIKEHIALGIPYTHTYSVGSGGNFPTLQAAFNWVATQPQFIEVASISLGTASFIKDSRTVAVTDLTQINSFDWQFASHISLATTSARKWYPLAHFSSDNTANVFIDVPYQEASSGAGVAYKYGYPIIYVLKVSDKKTTGTHVLCSPTSTLPNTIVQIDAVNCIVDFQENEDRSIVTAAFKSGMFAYVNMRSGEGAAGADLAAYITTSGRSVGDIYLQNIRRLTRWPGDWFVAEQQTGRTYVSNVQIYGNFDILMPWAAGRVDVRDCHFKAAAWRPGTQIQAISSLFSRSGAEARFKNCTIESSVSASGQNLRFEGFDPDTSLATANNVVLMDNCTFISRKNYGEVEGANWSFADLAISDSDIYFKNCTHTYEGNPTPQSTWKSWVTSSALLTASRIHYINSEMPDLAMQSTKAITTTLKGDMGVKALTASTANAFVTGELSAIRGSTFTATLAENITAIPIVSNAPDGTEITFIFTQNATGGFTVGWNASYKFSTAWSNAGNVLNTKSVVTFKKSGTLFIQTSAANVWV